MTGRRVLTYGTAASGGVLLSLRLAAAHQVVTSAIGVPGRVPR